MTADALMTTLLIIGALNLVGLALLAARVNERTRKDMTLEQRLVRLEVRVDTLPTHHDLGALHKAIGKTAEAVATISGQTQTITAMLRTIQQHLLENDP